jgi:hypothetical protein
MGIIDVDSDLDGSVDETNTAPEFVTPPNGKYRLKVLGVKIASRKAKNEETGEEVDKNSARASIAVVETIEVAEGDIPVPDGSMFSQQWQWTDQGKEYCKLFATKVLGGEAIKGATWRQVFEALEGAEFTGRVTNKVSVVNGKEYTNTNINDIKPA